MDDLQYTSVNKTKDQSATYSRICGNVHTFIVFCIQVRDAPNAHKKKKMVDTVGAAAMLKVVEACTRVLPTTTTALALSLVDSRQLSCPREGVPWPPSELPTTVRKEFGPSCPQTHSMTSLPYATYPTTPKMTPYQFNFSLR